MGERVEREKRMGERRSGGEIDDRERRKKMERRERAK